MIAFMHTALWQLYHANLSLPFHRYHSNLGWYSTDWRGQHTYDINSVHPDSDISLTRLTNRVKHQQMSNWCSYVRHTQGKYVTSLNWHFSMSPFLHQLFLQFQYLIFTPNAWHFDSTFYAPLENKLCKLYFSYLFVSCALWSVQRETKLRPQWVK